MGQHRHRPSAFFFYLTSRYWLPSSRGWCGLNHCIIAILLYLRGEWSEIEVIAFKLFVAYDMLPIAARDKASTDPSPCSSHPLSWPSRRCMYVRIKQFYPSRRHLLSEHDHMLPSERLGWGSHIGSISYLSDHRPVIEISPIQPQR